LVLANKLTVGVDPPASVSELTLLVVVQPGPAGVMLRWRMEFPMHWSVREDWRDVMA